MDYAPGAALMPLTFTLGHQGPYVNVPSDVHSAIMDASQLGPMLARIEDFYEDAVYRVHELVALRAELEQMLASVQSKETPIIRALVKLVQEAEARRCDLQVVAD